MPDNTESPETQTPQRTALDNLTGKKPRGRPSTYNEATAGIICARLCDGETLTNICKTPGMPSRQCVQQWRMRNPAFDASYFRAREIGMESMSDDTLTLADDDSGDMLPDGTPNSVNVNRSRLQIHARHFLMGKLSARYRDKVDHNHAGTITHAVTMADRERMRRLALFLAEDAGHTIEGETLPALPDDMAQPEPEPAAIDKHDDAI